MPEQPLFDSKDIINARISELAQHEESIERLTELLERLTKNDVGQRIVEETIAGRVHERKSKDRQFLFKTSATVVSASLGIAFLLFGTEVIAATGMAVIALSVMSALGIPLQDLAKLVAAMRGKSNSDRENGEK
ncbi:hypothetical protein [Thalassoporum mexicanum]|uniref:hypothetical protein n=1 Tax=Thalassoporum mexicanum TaxID=3457544 RepID=UPI0012EB0307|nr:hypothetical protein [Pseudanabaena sp. PCC 7367]